MPRVKACNTSKIKSELHDFPREFTKTPNNELYCNLCNCVVSCDKRFLAYIHRKTSKHQKALSKSELQMPQSSQTFLRSSNSDFVEKVSKAFLSANIPLYKVNNKHVKNLFSDVGHSLPAESTCRKTVLKLGADELQQIRNVVKENKFFGC